MEFDCTGPWSLPFIYFEDVLMMTFLFQKTLVCSCNFKHVTNDVCFVYLMEAAILKILLARRRFSHFYDAEKRLLRNKWSSGVFKQHYLINHFDLLRKIRFVCAYKAEPNSNRSQHFISNGQEKGRNKNNTEIKHDLHDTDLYRQLLPIITNIFIFIAIALDKNCILVAVYFSMQNIYQSCDLGRALGRSNVVVSQ